MMTVTVLSGPERRRRWTSGEKLQIVEESFAPAARVTEIARRHNVHPNQLHLWRRQARAGTLSMALDGGCRFASVAVASSGGIAVPARSDAGAQAAVIEVVLRNGRLLRLPEGVAEARVVALADALEGIGR